MPAVRSRAVFVVGFPLQQRDPVRFGFGLLSGRGFEVEVWDISRLLHPQWVAARTGDWPCQYHFDSLNALGVMARQLGNDDWVIGVGGLGSHEQPVGASVYAVLESSGALVTALDQTALVIPERLGRKLGIGIRAIIKSILLATAIGVRRNLLFGGSPRGPGSRLSVRLDAVWAATSTLSLAKEFKWEPASVRYIHQLDYDAVLDNPKRQSEVPYFVYLDTLGSPDGKVMGLNRPLDDAHYATLVTEALIHMRESLRAPILVAPHPSGSAQSVADLYQKLCVGTESTAALLAGAAGVVTTTFSTAIGMAVSYSLPVVVLESREFDAVHRRELRFLARALGTPIIQIPISEVLPPARVRLDLYERYMTQRVKLKGTPQAKFWDQVADEVEALLERRAEAKDGNC